LAIYFGVHADTIKDYIAVFKSVGLKFDQDRHYKCAILPDRQFKELNHLLPLSVEERATISKALHQFSSKNDAMYLVEKLSTLYDFQKLGIRALRRPALEKIELLNAAKRGKLQVTLQNYRSNSSDTRDRIVEPFHLEPDLGILQAYELESNESKHFKLSRIERVLTQDAPWQFETKHQHQYTDVFGIANDQTEMIQLKLNVQGYNILVETYPKSRAEIYPAADSGFFDFQTKVNAEFKGISNFILGNAAHVEVIANDQLLENLQTQVAAMQKQFEKK